jgi:hypothetical protein
VCAAALTEVPVQEWGERFFFRWCGTTYQANMARTQQQVAWVNVLKGIPPQMMGGRRLDLSPFLEMGTENIFGPEIAPRILIDDRNMFTVAPDMENEILHNGMNAQVHEADNDTEHLQSHMRAANLTGDPGASSRRTWARTCRRCRPSASAPRPRNSRRASRARLAAVLRVPQALRGRARCLATRVPSRTRPEPSRRTTCPASKGEGNGHEETQRQEDERGRAMAAPSSVRRLEIRAQDDLRTIERAQEVVGDSKRLAAAKAEAKRQKESLDRIARLQDKKL